MNLAHYFLLGALITTGLYGCKKNLAPTAPSNEFTKKVYVPSPSELNVPVVIPIKAVNEKLNKELKGLIYEDSSLTDNNNDNLLLKVWKQGDIKVDVKYDYFDYTVPLKIWAKYGVSILGFTQFGETDLGIKLRFKTKIRMDSTWKIVSHTEPQGYEWITSPILRIGVMEIPIKFIGDLILESQKKELAKMIDQQASQTINIKTYAKDIFKTLQSPIEVSSDPKIWLKIAPKSFSMTPFYGQTGNIKSALGLVASTETIFGLKPSIKIDTVLPNLRLTNVAKNNFFIAISADVPYEYATEMARKMQNGLIYEFKEGKYKIKIEDMLVYGNGDKVAVKTDISGSIKGTIYLTGIPVYDELNQSIFIKNVDFDIDTRNKLLKTANWMMNGAIEKKLEKSLVFPLKDQLNDSKKLIQKTLQNNRIQPGVLLQGKLNTLEPKDVLVTKDGIRAFVEAKGNLEIKIDGF